MTAKRDKKQDEEMKKLENYYNTMKIEITDGSSGDEQYGTARSSASSHDKTAPSGSVKKKSSGNRSSPQPSTSAAAMSAVIEEELPWIEVKRRGRRRSGPEGNTSAVEQQNRRGESTKDHKLVNSTKNAPAAGTSRSQKNSASKTAKKLAKKIAAIKEMERLKALNPKDYSLPFFTIHPCLRSYKDCFFDWILPNKPFTKESAETIALVLEGKYANLNPDMILKEIKIMPFETIANHLIIAFCHIVLKNASCAHEKLSEVTSLIGTATDTDVISVDHLEGLVYVYSGLEAHKMSIHVEQDFNKEHTEYMLKEYVNGLMPFSELTRSAKVAIKGVRAYFFGTDRVIDEQISLLRQIVGEEPAVVEWHVAYHYVMRLERRQRDRRAVPPVEEYREVITALDLAQTNVLVKLAVCLYVVDIIRVNPDWKRNYDIELSAGIVFRSDREAIKYITRVANEILLEMEHSVKINLCLAEIFSLALPRDFRDYKLAKKCYLNALTTNPTSSKANHKYGLYLLTEENKPEEALKYIREAFLTDDRNFSALIDIIQALMRDIPKYDSDIKRMFDMHSNNLKWPDSRRSNLYALYALYYFQKKEYKKCVDAWVQSYKLQKEGLDSLTTVQYHMERYHWNKEAINAEMLKSFMESVLKCDDSYEVGKVAEEDLDCIRYALRKLDEGVSRNERRVGGGGGDRAGPFRRGGRGRGRGIRGNWREDGQQPRGNRMPPATVTVVVSTENQNGQNLGDAPQDSGLEA